MNAQWMLGFEYALISLQTHGLCRVGFVEKIQQLQPLTNLQLNQP